MQTTERYMHGYHESVLTSHSWRTIDNSAAYLAPYLEPGQHLLDLGSGAATITIDFGRRLSAGRVTGIDTSPEVVERGRRMAEAEGLDNVEFLVDDAYQLSFPDDTFDVAHAHQVLQHLGDPIAALRELKRVVKPGGLIAARDVIYGSAAWYPLLPGLDEWMSTYRAVAALDRGDPDAGRSLKAWAMEAGLDVVASSASIWCFSTDEEREFWGGTWSRRATESTFAAQAVESGIAGEADLEAISSAWDEWVASPVGWFGLPHGEIVARV